MLSSSLLSTLIALSGVFLGLSLLVQVLQEVYKYLTSSKSRSYLKVLVDFLGPFAYQLIRPGTLPELQSRGPLQWLRRRPSGRLQPLDRNDLASALERAAAPWIRRGLEALRLEAEIQGGSRRPRSPAFQSFMLQLAGVERGSPGFATAVELSRFLSDWQVETSPVGRAVRDEPNDERPFPDAQPAESWEHLGGQVLVVELE